MNIGESVVVFFKEHDDFYSKATGILEFHNGEVFVIKSLIDGSSMCGSIEAGDMVCIEVKKAEVWREHK